MTYILPERSQALSISSSLPQVRLSPSRPSSAPPHSLYQRKSVIPFPIGAAGIDELAEFALLSNIYSTPP
jgi:hypothetical protein